MKLYINGKIQEVKNVCNVQDLLININQSQESVAIAVNMVCIPQHQYKTTILKDGDQIEILVPMQGG